MPLEQRTLTDGVDVRIGGSTVAVDHHAASFPDLEARGACQFVSWSYSGGKHNQVRFELAAVGETNAMRASLAIHDLGGVLSCVDADAQLADAGSQHAAAGLIVFPGRFSMAGGASSMRLS